MANQEQTKGWGLQLQSGREGRSIPNDKAAAAKSSVATVGRGRWRWPSCMATAVVLPTSSAQEGQNQSAVIFCDQAISRPPISHKLRRQHRHIYRGVYIIGKP